jgi:hypothetical protein
MLLRYECPHSLTGRLCCPKRARVSAQGGKKGVTDLAEEFESGVRRDTVFLGESGVLLRISFKVRHNALGIEHVDVVVSLLEDRGDIRCSRVRSQQKLRIH